MNREEFFNLVDQGITIVDFFATWCGPCKAQTTVFNYLKKFKNLDDITFIKFDVDNNDREVSDNFEIESIPTLIVFKDGQEEFRFIGITGADVLLEAIKKVQKNKISF